MAFSLELSEDVIEVRDWVHQFAAQVVAAGRGRMGRARGDAVADHPGGREGRVVLNGTVRAPGGRAQRAGDADRVRGAVLGRRRHRAVDPGYRVGGGVVGRERHSRAARGVAAADVRHARRSVTRRRSARRNPAPARTSAAIITRARFDEATDEWVINGTKTWATNGGIANVHIVVASVDPELGSPWAGDVHHPAGHQRVQPGPEVQEARHPGVAHRRSGARRRPDSRQADHRRQGQVRRTDRPGEVRARAPEGRPR